MGGHGAVEPRPRGGRLQGPLQRKGALLEQAPLWSWERRSTEGGLSSQASSHLGSGQAEPRERGHSNPSTSLQGAGGSALGVCASPFPSHPGVFLLFLSGPGLDKISDPQEQEKKK